MIKQQTAYKVCAVHENTFVSAMYKEHPKFVLQYELSKKTVAKIGYIYLFDGEAMAKYFAACSNVMPYVILQGIAHNIPTLTPLGISPDDFMDSENVHAFWTKFKKRRYQQRADSFWAIMSQYAKPETLVKGKCPVYIGRPLTGTILAQAFTPTQIL